MVMPTFLSKNLFYYSDKPDICQCVKNLTTRRHPSRLKLHRYLLPFLVAFFQLAPVFILSAGQLAELRGIGCIGRICALLINAGDQILQLGNALFRLL